MRNFTIFLGLVVAATAILGAPSSSPVGSVGGNLRSYHRSGSKNSVSGNHQIQSIISLRFLAKIGTRDSFADLIERVLGQSPTDFLSDIDAVFKEVDLRVKESRAGLDNAIAKADAATKTKIQRIQTTAITQIFRVTENFLRDLAKVLIGMPKGEVSKYDPIADLIRSILCKTLQQFVENIKNALDGLSTLLQTVIDDVLDIADETRNHELMDILRTVADIHLMRARVIIQPVLDKMSNLLNFSRNMMRRNGIPLSESHERRGLLDATVMSVFGFSAQTAAYQADEALSELIPLIESSRDELIQAVAIPGGDDHKVGTKVMEIYDTAMDNFIGDVKPIYNNIIDLQGSGCNSTYVYDLMASLPGIGIDYFANYLRHGTMQTQTNLKTAFAQILEAAAELEGGPEAVERVSKVLQKQSKSFQAISEPLMETLRPVLEDPSEKTGLQVAVKHSLEEEDEGWLDTDGALYNRDALIQAVSNELGFDVEEGAVALKTSLQNVDDLLGLTLIRLDAILADHDVDIQSEILGIMNETLINVHVSSQPMLNVLLPFIPDGLRSNKHIALDIYTGISEVEDIDEFTAYCKASAKEIMKLTDEAMTELKLAAQKASPEANEEIESLFDTAQALTKAYIMPFIEIIRPIISPDV